MFEISQLRRVRASIGMTQAEFARHAGVSQSLITKIESGKLDPKYSTVRRIEQAIAQLEHRKQPTAETVMHKGIISATLHEPLPHLIKRMQRTSISQVPVMDGQHVAGLINERIILEAMSEGKDLSKLAAQDIMADAPPILPPTIPLSTAIKLLEHIPLLIIKDKKRIVGIVTRADLIKASV
jgi:predicted transcriptional regulator